MTSPVLTTGARKPRSGFVFTGFHMWMVMIGFFGTIISVNVLMAYYATSSWSGLVVENTYVASQKFNQHAAEERARIADGMKGVLTVEGDRILYTVTKAGAPVSEADKVTLSFKRPVGTHQDFEVTLSSIGNGRYSASHAVLGGQWIVEARVLHDDRLIIHEANRIVIQG